ncbi:MAG: polysaccharide biosynthesis C-terminal domain-containing protein, partial [Thermotogaceae bacterium]|nr:polysaccharide biosynthesis C-terminal domain-containing protein [Thermotogaceae bacterium]
LPGLRLVPIIVASYYFVFLYSFPVNLEFYLKKTHIISLGTILAGAINIFLNYIFIPTFGYSAAAFTTLVSYIFLFAFHYFNARVLFKKNLFPLRYFLYGMLIIFGFITVFYMFVSKPFIRYSIILISTLITLRFLKKNVIDQSQ